MHTYYIISLFSRTPASFAQELDACLNNYVALSYPLLYSIIFYYITLYYPLFYYYILLHYIILYHIIL